MLFATKIEIFMKSNTRRSTRTLLFESPTFFFSADKKLIVKMLRVVSEDIKKTKASALPLGAFMGIWAASKKIQKSSTQKL